MKSYVFCDKLDGETWSCHCAGKDISDEPFDFTSTSEPIDVCSEAKASCPLEAGD
jgi:hypothetical protein